MVSPIKKWGNGGARLMLGLVSTLCIVVAGVAASRASRDSVGANTDRIVTLERASEAERLERSDRTLRFGELSGWRTSTDTRLEHICESQERSTLELNALRGELTEFRLEIVRTLSGIEGQIAAQTPPGG